MAPTPAPTSAKKRKAEDIAKDAGKRHFEEQKQRRALAIAAQQQQQQPQQPTQQRQQHTQQHLQQRKQKQQISKEEAFARAKKFYEGKNMVHENVGQQQGQPRPSLQQAIPQQQPMALDHDEQVFRFGSQAVASSPCTKGTPGRPRKLKDMTPSRRTKGVARKSVLSQPLRPSSIPTSSAAYAASNNMTNDDIDSEDQDQDGEYMEEMNVDDASDYGEKKPKRLRASAADDDYGTRSAPSATILPSSSNRASLATSKQPTYRYDEAATPVPYVSTASMQASNNTKRSVGTPSYHYEEDTTKTAAGSRDPTSRTYRAREDATRISSGINDIAIQSSFSSAATMMTTTTTSPEAYDKFIPPSGRRMGSTHENVVQRTPPRSTLPSKQSRIQNTFKPPFGSPMPESTIRRRHVASQPKPFPISMDQDEFVQQSMSSTALQGVDDIASSLRTHSEEKARGARRESGSYDTMKNGAACYDDYENAFDEEDEVFSKSCLNVQDEDDADQNEQKNWICDKAKSFAIYLLCGLFLAAIVWLFGWIISATISSLKSNDEIASSCLSLFTSMSAVFNGNKTLLVQPFVKKSRSGTPPCFAEAIDKLSRESLSILQSHDESNRDGDDGLPYSLPSDCEPTEPCPVAAQCYKGVLLECIDATNFAISPNNDSCVLTHAGEVYVQDVKELLHHKMVKVTCSSYGTKVEHPFLVNEEMENGKVNMLPLPSMTRKNDEVLFRYQDLTKQLEKPEDVMLLEIANQHLRTFLVKSSDTNEIFVGLDPTVPVTIPAGCQFKLLMKQIFNLIGQTTWKICSVVFRWLWGTFYDDPFFAISATLIATISGSIVLYVTRQRALIRQLEVDVVSLRQRVITELSSQPGKLVAVHLLCERIAWDDAPRSRARRSRITNVLWPIIATDINSDRRVKKTKKANAYDSNKLFDHWQWIDDTTVN